MKVHMNHMLQSSVLLSASEEMVVSFKTHVTLADEGLENNGTYSHVNVVGSFSFQT